MLGKLGPPLLALSFINKRIEEQTQMEAWGQAYWSLKGKPSQAGELSISAAQIKRKEKIMVLGQLLGSHMVGRGGSKEKQGSQSLRKVKSILGLRKKETEEKERKERCLPESGIKGRQQADPDKNSPAPCRDSSRGQGFFSRGREKNPGPLSPRQEIPSPQGSYRGQLFQKHWNDWV